MSNLFFLDIEQVLDVVLGEMPGGVYATDRADSPDFTKRSYSSSEIRAHAQIYANLYANLQDIYQDKFLSTVQPDGLVPWETDLFLVPQDSSQSFDVRQANLIAKYRSTGGLSVPYLTSLVSAILTPLGIPFVINVFGGLPEGAWILDQSPLDFDTYLSELAPLVGEQGTGYHLDCNATIAAVGNTTASSNILSGLIIELTTRIEVGAGVTGAFIPSGTTVVSVGPTAVVMSQNATGSSTQEDIQIQNYLAAGITLEQLQEIQRTAYTYGVYIYGNASAMVLSQIDQVLTRAETGGSTHQIFNNAAPPMDPNVIDLGGGVECTLEDSIDCGNASFGATYDVWDFSI